VFDAVQIVPGISSAHQLHVIAGYLFFLWARNFDIIA